MNKLSVQEQKIINELKQAHPELKKYSDEQILTIYNEQLANMKIPEDKSVSILNTSDKANGNNIELEVETSPTPITPEQENQLKQALIERINSINSNLEKIEESNGFIASIWSWSKNKIPYLDRITDSSDEVREQQKAELKLLESGNIEEVFKSITDLDYTSENINKFLNNEVQTKSEVALNNYHEGQKMSLDVGADIISGIVAVGAVAVAPLTGGASLALAAGVGAVVKVGIKYAGSDDYDLKDLAYDAITGSINGAFAPITNGLGGSAGTVVAKTFGLKSVESSAKAALAQAVKQAGKTVTSEVAEEIVEQTAKQTGKSLLGKILAKQGAEYVLKEGAEKTLKTTVGKTLAYTVDMMVDGSISGAVDGLARSVGQGRFEDIPEEMLNGFIGGAIASPIIGGGFRGATAAGSTILKKINNKISFSTLLPDGMLTKFKQGLIGDCALLSMLNNFMANKKTQYLLSKVITTTADGNYAVKIKDKTVIVLRSSLTDEMLADNPGIRIFEQAYKQLVGDIDGGFADVVAMHFGQKPVHIIAENITDEVLEKIAKNSDDLTLCLGVKLNAEGVVDPNGTYQHYFSIKNIDPETKTVTLVDTYDTSKTLTMSFDDVKTQGVSIDGGSLKDIDLPNSVRNADDVKFRGDGLSNINNEMVERVEREVKKIFEENESFKGHLKDFEYALEGGYSVLEAVEYCEVSFKDLPLPLPLETKFKYYMVKSGSDIMKFNNFDDEITINCIRAILGKEIQECTPHEIACFKNTICKIKYEEDCVVTVGGKSILMTEDQKILYKEMSIEELFGIKRGHKIIENSNFQTSCQQLIMTDVALIHAMALEAGIPLENQTSEELFQALKNNYFKDKDSFNSEFFAKLKENHEAWLDAFFGRDSVCSSINEICGDNNGDAIVHEISKGLLEYFKTNNAKLKAWYEFCSKNEKVLDYLKIMECFAKDFRTKLEKIEKIKKPEEIIKLQEIYHVIYRAVQRDATIIDVIEQQTKNSINYKTINFIDKIISIMSDPNSGNAISKKNQVIGYQLAENLMITYQDNILHTIEYYDPFGSFNWQKQYGYYPSTPIL